MTPRAQYRLSLSKADFGLSLPPANLALCLLLAACANSNSTPSTSTDRAASSPIAFSAEIDRDNSWQNVNADFDARKKRLERLSETSLIGGPKFYEYLISKNELPGFPIDMPVLRVVFEEKVFFDTARSRIRPEANKVLDVVASALRQEPREVALFVAGHTDARGSDQYNLELSIKRATSVARALLNKGIGQAAVWRIGFGKSVPLRPNDSDTNMALNRRVEFILATKPAAVAVWLAKQVETLCADKAVDCKELTAAKGSFTAAPVSLAEQSTARPDDVHVNEKQSSTSLVSIHNRQPIAVNLTTKTIQVGRPLQ